MDLNSNCKIESNETGYKKWGRRHVIVVHLFFAYALSFAHKVNLSVGIVSMMDNSDNKNFPKYDWNEQHRGWILSSLFWGYAITPLIGGIICQRYGARQLLFLTVLIGSILTIITPIAADWGWMYVCTNRFIIGLTQGFLYPCVYTLIPKWIHPSERGFLTSIIFSGSKMGMIITLLFSGLLAASPVMGWPSIFYLSGTAGLLWSVCWFIMCAESPDKCQQISNKEREYIYSEIKIDTKLAIPWASIMKSIPFWSLFFTAFTSSLLFFLLLTEIPTYLNGVLKFSIKSNAFLSSVPYMAMFLFSLFISYFSDLSINRKYCTVDFARKTSNTIATWIPSILLILLGYIMDNVVLAVIILIIIVGLNSGVNNGFLVNHMDLSPNFSGTLVGLTATAQNISSILGPLLVGYVVSDTHDITLWRIVFYITGATASFGNLVFIIFGTTKLQSWNSSELDLKKDVNANQSRCSTIELGTLDSPISTGN